MKMSRALIGHTGFIGSNLVGQMVFDDFYDSKNIESIKGKKYDLVISAANSGLRWMVNQDPARDLDNIKAFIKNISDIRAGIFVLISTIDVYRHPIGVYEDHPADADGSNPYGKNRLYLENFVRNNFTNHLVIRLPVVYGMNLKKNIIYDVLNNNEVEKIDPTATLQFYNAANLASHITTALDSKISVLNMATAPIVVKELMKESLGVELNNKPGKGLVYDMGTRHAAHFGKSENYIYTRAEIIEDLKFFKEQYRK